jgi:autotransporter-associated beta strand protein
MRQGHRIISHAAAVTVAAIVSTFALPQARGQIIYVTNETAANPLGVFYNDGGTWLYAGGFNQSLASAPVLPYGIARSGSDLYITESKSNSTSTASGRLIKTDLFGSSFTSLYQAGSGNTIKGDPQQATIGPDGNVYVSTAFAGSAPATGGPSGIWRSDASGGNLTNIIPKTGTGWDLTDCRDVYTVDLDNNPANGFDLYATSRGGFSATARPIYHFNVNGATATLVEALTTTGFSPASVYYDAATNKVYYGRTSGTSPQVYSLNPTGSGQTGAAMFNNANPGIDIGRIGNDVVALGGTGELRVIAGTSGAAGTLIANLATVSSNAIAAARAFAVIQASELVTATWDGGAGAAGWSANANWAGDTAPDFSGTSALPPRLVFDGTAQTTASNNTPNTKVGNVSFAPTAGAFTLTGNALSIAVAGGINNLSTNTQTISTGQITWSGGGLSATNGDLVINSPVTFSSPNGLMSIAGTKNVTMAGAITGAAPIDKRNALALRLTSPSNDYAGTMTVNDGAVVYDAAGPAGLGANSTTTIPAAGVGRVELSNGASLNGKISLAGRTAQADGTFAPQVVNVSGNNTLSDTLVLTGGGTSSVIESQAGKLTVNAAVQNNNGAAGTAALRLQGAGDGVFTATFGGGSSGGAITVNKAGSGTWTLNGPFASNAGNVNVLAGTLKLGSVPSSGLAFKTTLAVDPGATLDTTAASTFELAPSQTLRGAGTVKAQNLTVYEDNIVQPGNDTAGNLVGTLAVQGNLNVNNSFGATGGGLQYELGSATNVGDRIDVQGDLALNSSGGAIPLAITPVQGTFASGTYKLLGYTGTGSGETSTFSVTPTGGAANYRQTFAVQVDTSGKAVNLVVSGATKTLTWAGTGAGPAGAANFEIKGAANFTDGANPEQFYLGDTVQFVDSATAQHTVALKGLITGILNVNSSEDYTLDGSTVGGVDALSTGTVVNKTGTGTLTITCPTATGWTWDGYLNVNQGVVQFAGFANGGGGMPIASDPAGHAHIVLNGGTLRLTGAGLSTSRTFTLGGNGGTIDVQGTAAATLGNNGKPVVFSGSSPRTLTVTGAQNLTLGGALGDGPGGATSVVKTGSNIFSLTAVNTYTGTTTVSAGRINMTTPASLGTPDGGTTVASGGGVLMTLGAGSFNVAEPFTIAGTGWNNDNLGALRFGNANSNVTVTAPVALSGSATIGVDDATQTATLAGGVTGAGDLTKASSGRLAISAASSYTGATIVAGGNLRLIGAGTVGTGDVTNNATLEAYTTVTLPAVDGTGTTRAGDGTTAVTVTANRFRQATLNVGAGSTAVVAPSGTAAGVSKVNALVLGANSKLDLKNNRLITADAVGSAVGTTYTGVLGQVQSGRGNGTWNGASGIVTSQTDATTTTKTSLGVATGAQALGLTGTDTATWGGQTVAATSTLVMYTYGGDADLNGQLNGDDYFRIDSHVGVVGGGWFNGDFDYSGKVDGDDYFVLDSNINNQTLGVFSAAAAADGLPSGAGIAAVPEPASLLLAVPAALLAAGRRRRRRVCRDFARGVAAY